MIGLRTSVRLYQPIENSYENAVLIFRWESNNKFKYPIAKYIIEMSTNNSRFVRIDDDQFRNKYTAGK